MKTPVRLISPVVPALAGLLLVALSTDLASAQYSAGAGMRRPAARPGEQEPEGSPLLEDYWFDALHYPYGRMLNVDLRQLIRDGRESTPQEGPAGSPPPATEWISLGPNGMNLADGTKYSGRILDIEVENNGGAGVRIASASGGLWEYRALIPVPLSENLPTLAIGSFDTDPASADVILVGTGEPNKRFGYGVYRTTDGGKTWGPTFMSPLPEAFYRVRFAPGSSSLVHAASNQGYYRSTDGGRTWVRMLSGNTTDLAINPRYPDSIFTPVLGDGLWRSTDGGLNWKKLDAGGIPLTNTGRASIAVAPSNPSYIYVGMAKPDKTTLGAFRSTNGGKTWESLGATDFYKDQGDYNNVIAVSPVDPNFVYLGGWKLYGSASGGSPWSDVKDPAVHDDIHAIAWKSDGSTIYVGSDGGLAVSFNYGLQWSTLINTFPVTQFYHVDVPPLNSDIILGGTQDNGVPVSSDGGRNWTMSLGGDGGCVTSLSTGSALTRLYATVGVYDGPSRFKRHRSTDKGITWQEVENGTDSSKQWFTKIRASRQTYNTLYSTASGFVYRSTDRGDSWSRMNGAGFPSWIWDLRVGVGDILYATVDDATPGKRIYVYDNGTWQERSAGLPGAMKFLRVSTAQWYDAAYAVAMGQITGPRLFRTTNRGISWQDISVNLPAASVTDVVAHPRTDSILYVATTSGCYKTKDLGATWYTWNKGMPPANIISELTTIDSIFGYRKYYVVAASYGRGAWKREVSADDAVTSVRQIESPLPETYELRQNYPNPFNPRTLIGFRLPVSGQVSLIVYSASGQQVRRLAEGVMAAGTYEIEFDGEGLASGVYFCRLTCIPREASSAGGFTATRKMLLVR